MSRDAGIQDQKRPAVAGPFTSRLVTQADGLGKVPHYHLGKTIHDGSHDKDS